MKKEHILDEIRGNAQANGGLPLGGLAFYKQTDIKESDGAGTFWARWNDAVREAGFEPNQKRGAFAEDYVIEKFVALMREIGRFRTVTELRMKKLSDPTVPNSKVYERFRSQPQLAAKIAEYATGREGYAQACLAPPYANPRTPAKLSAGFATPKMVISNRHTPR